jgi:putative transposase
MKLSDVVPISVGSRIGYLNQPWIIESQEDEGRVLARHVGTGRREFITIDNIEAPPNNFEKGDGDQANASDPMEGTWTRDLNSRKVRVLKVTEDDAKGDPKLKDHKKLFRLQEHFKSLVATLALPRGHERSEAIKKLCSEYGYSTGTAYRNLKIVELNGTPESLQRGVRSDLGEFNLTDKQRKIIVKIIDEKRFCPTPSPMSQVLILVNGDLVNENEKKIGLTTLKKFEKSLKTPREVLEAQGRKEKVRNLHRPKVGHLPGAVAPLRVVQVDHTPTQVVLVDEETRQPISDAWLTIVIDCFSRMVLGFVLSFSAPSALRTGLALARSMLPKGDFLKKLGVPGEWPAWGYPQIIHVDNGSDLNGHMMHAAKRQWRFNLRNRPKGQPNFGGHVESAFATYMKQFANTLDGTKFHNPTFRGEYDAEGNAIFTIKEFEACFTDWLINQYHRTPHRGDGMNDRTPLQRWKAGLFDGDVCLPIGLIPVPRDKEQLRISFLPIYMRTVNQGTVTIFDETYYSVDLEKISDNLPSYADRVGKKSRTFEVRYDPLNMEFIWIFNEKINVYVAARVQDESCVGLTLWEHREKRRRRGIPDETDDVMRYESIKRLGAATERARADTKSVRKAIEQSKINAEEQVVKSTRDPRAEGKKTPKIDEDQMLEDLIKKVRPRL